MSSIERGHAHAPLCSDDYFRRVSGDYARYSCWTASAELIEAEFSALREHARPRPVVVDVGAGTSEFLHAAGAARVFDRPVLVALDRSLHMLVRPLSITREVSRLLADAHRLPLRPCSVDRVIGRQVLHYVDLPRALVEIKRVLAANGVFHSTQQVDYDELPDRWYDAWSALRGARSRRRLSDASLSAATVRAGLSELSRRYVSIRLTYSWADLARKYGRAEDDEEMRGFFRDSPTQCLESFEFRISDAGVGYTSRFRVSSFGHLD